MKPAKIAVVCLAAISAIGLAFVVRAMGTSNPPGAPAAAAAVEQRPMAKVMVAAKDLAPGKRLEDGDLTWKDWAVADLNPAFITDGTAPTGGNTARPATGAVEGAVEGAVKAASDTLTGGAKSDFIGAVVREPILAGEPIVARKIVRAGDSGYLAAYLEPGMRAMAIRVTVETAAGGFILPGDRVDVVLTRELQAGAANNAVEGGNSAASRFVTGTVMQNIKVLAIDQTTRAADDEQAVVGATATLEVRPADAEVLALAKAEGELSLMLRSYADTAGPSGSVYRGARGGAARTAAVRVFRGGEPQLVSVP